MSLDALKNQIADFAKDVRLNLSSMASDETLTPLQKYGIFAACGIASRNPQVRQALVAEAAQHLDETSLNAAKSAAAIMGMNNVYYRFLHLAENDEYVRLPAKLRMNVIGVPGTAKENFELWSLAVSAINGCGMCITAHEKVVRAAGLTVEQVQAAVRIAAVVHAVAVTLEAESASTQVLAQAA